MCSLIISDSVAIEIFAVGQPCSKIFRKVWCATFLRHGVELLLQGSYAMAFLQQTHGGLAFVSMFKDTRSRCRPV